MTKKDWRHLINVSTPTMRAKDSWASKLRDAVESEISEAAKVLSIASAARQWDAARMEALTFKGKRSAFMCERSEKYDANDPAAPDMYEVPSTTCWKKIVGPFHDGAEGEDARRLTPDEQCASCRERYAVHLAMKAAVRRRGANLRAMMQLLATERKRLGFDERYERKPADPARGEGAGTP